MKSQNLEKIIEELRHRVETLELALDTILKKVPEIRINVEVPKIILEKKPIHIKIKMSELHGRIMLLAIEGFLKDWKTAGDITSELVRRGCAPKDFRHVRPVLEHLVSLGLIERIRSPKKNRGRKSKWLYKAVEDLLQKVELVQ